MMASSKPKKTIRISMGGMAFSLALTAIAVSVFFDMASDSDVPDRESAIVMLTLGWLLGTVALALAVLALFGFGKREGGTGSFFAILAIPIGCLYSIFVPTTIATSIEMREANETRARIARLANEGRREEALATADELIAEKEAPNALRQRAMIHFRGGDYDRALQDLDRAIEIYPQYRDAFASRSLVYESRGDFNAAMRDISRAIELKESDIEARLQRINLYLTLGRFRDMVVDCDQLLEHVPENDRRNLYGVYAMRARANLELGDAKRGRLDATKAISYRPGEFGGHNLMGMALNNLGQFSQAVESLQKATSLDPEQPSAWSNLGVAYLALGQPAQAESAFKKAIEVDPKFAIAWGNLSVLYYRNNLPDDAMQMAERALELNDSLTDALLIRGAVRLGAGKPEEALADLDRILSLGIKTYDSYYFRGEALLELDRFDAAMASFDAAIELSPDVESTAMALFARGVTHYYKDNFSACLNDCDEAIKLAPQFASAHLQRAEALDALGQKQAAEASRTRAFEIDPSLRPAEPADK